tara:strand:- start:10 stop:159 length:150 start_codon:yes stop_codon:yes gene_type:complete
VELVTQVVLLHQKETQVEREKYLVNLVLQQEVVAMEQQVETQQHQELVV